MIETTNRKYRGYWNDKEKCREVANCYTNRSEFQRNDYSAYISSSRNGWLEEICSHMKERKKPNGHWENKFNCKYAAKLSKSRGEFYRNNQPAYKVALKNGWLGEFYPLVPFSSIKKDKRLINTPFNYTGNKYKLLEQILPEFDYSKRNFVDLFCGGGSVYTNVIEDFEKVMINDVIKDLVGIHQNLLLNSEDFIRTTKSIVVDVNNQKQYNELRDSYNSNQTPEKFFVLMLTCFSNMVKFNNKFQFNQTYGKRSWKPKTDEKLTEFINQVSPNKNKITYSSERFENVMIPKDSMVYIDPPYSNTDAGYNRYWKQADDEKLYNYILELHKNGNSFVLSGALSHDCKESALLKKLIKDGFSYKRIKCDYSKASRSKKNKNTVEIIIKNF